MSGKRRGLLSVSPQGGLFTGMALAGLITVALTVTADRGNAGGIDGLRAIVPGPAGPTAAAVVNAPPPVFPPPSVTASQTARPTGTPASADPAAAISAPTPPTPTASAPAAAAPDPSTPSPTASAPAPAPADSTPAPSAPPPTSPLPTPTPAPTASPSPSPSPAPAPVALTTDRGATALITLGDIVPGDSITRTMAVRNTGTSDFRYTVSASQTAGTLLWTDGTDGLQLTLRTPGGTVLYSGPLSGLGTVAAPNVVAAGAPDDLVYAFSLPASASNAFQGLAQDLTIVFTAVQFP